MLSELQDKGGLEEAGRITRMRGRITGKHVHTMPMLHSIFTHISSPTIESIYIMSDHDRWAKG